MKSDKYIDFQGVTYKAVADYSGLRQAMKDNGITSFRQLARLGLTSNTQSALSQGRVIGQETILRLCLAFHCQPADLFRVSFEAQKKGPTASELKEQRRREREAKAERRKALLMEGRARKERAKASRQANIARSLDPELARPWNE